MYYPYIHLGYDIPVYGLSLVVGFFVSIVIIFYYTKKNKLCVDHLLIIVSFSLIGIIVGAKLMYISVTYTVQEIYEQVIQRNFSVWTDYGMVYYGGLIGGVIASYFGAEFAGTSWLPYIHTIIPSVPFAHAIGRVGCCFAGCCFGWPYDGLFSVEYPMGEQLVSVFPIQLVEALCNCILGFILIKYSVNHKISLAHYLVPYSIMRFIIEFFRGDIKRGFLGFFSISQWISIFILFFVIIRYLCVKCEKGFLS